MTVRIADDQVARIATLPTAAVAQPAAMGDYRWTSTWTPNPSGTVQVQSLRRVAPQVGLTVTKRKVTAAVRRRVNGKMRTVRKVSTSVRFSAQATANGAAPSSTRMTTTAAGKRIGAARAAASPSQASHSRAPMPPSVARPSRPRRR